MLSKMLAAMMLCVGANAADIIPPDTSLATLPVAYYGANWHRSDDNIEMLSKMQIVVLMQEDGPCWLKCCPNATLGGPGQCGAVSPHNASALPGCDSSCDQHGTQSALFGRVKAAAAKEGRRSPHCMLYMNTVYLWPFDAADSQGDAIRVLDIHGQPHMETCDPGIFPSYFFDYGKPAGQRAWLDIVSKNVVNGNADGVYADCYATNPLRCSKDATNDTCTARRNGKVLSLNEEVTRDQHNAYQEGMEKTMLEAFKLVGPDGSFYSKDVNPSKPPPFGGNLVFVDNGFRHSGLDPAQLIDTVSAAKKAYKYVIVGSGNGFSDPHHNPESLVSHCDDNKIAAFLLALEPGCFALCNGWDPLYARPLGQPLGKAVHNNATQTWSRSFTGGTSVSWTNGKGTVHWTNTQ